MTPSLGLKLQTKVLLNIMLCDEEVGALPDVFCTICHAQQVQALKEQSFHGFFKNQMSGSLFAGESADWGESQVSSSQFSYASHPLPAEAPLNFISL